MQGNKENGKVFSKNERLWWPRMYFHATKPTTAQNQQLPHSEQPRKPVAKKSDKCEGSVKCRGIDQLPLEMKKSVRIAGSRKNASGNLGTQGRCRGTKAGEGQLNCGASPRTQIPSSWVLQIGNVGRQRALRIGLDGKPGFGERGRQPYGRQ